MNTLQRFDESTDCQNIVASRGFASEAPTSFGVVRRHAAYRARAWTASEQQRPPQRTLNRETACDGAAIPSRIHGLMCPNAGHVPPGRLLKEMHGQFAEHE
jgi:hypothetical protein